MEQLLGYTEMTSTLGHLLHFDKDLLPPSGTGSWHLATFLSTGSPSLEDKWEKLTPLTIRPSSVVWIARLQAEPFPFLSVLLSF